MRKLTLLLLLVLISLPASCGVSRMSVVNNLFEGRKDRREREREEELTRQWEAEREGWDQEARDAADRRQDYVDDHPGLDDDLKQDILYGVAGIGMTREQVRASWGMPEMVNPMGGSARDIEVWLYGRKQLTFTEGYLTSLYDPEQD